jgi:hypothetical protein
VTDLYLCRFVLNCVDRVNGSFSDLKLVESWIFSSLYRFCVTDLS